MSTVRVVDRTRFMEELIKLFPHVWNFLSKRSIKLRQKKILKIHEGKNTGVKSTFKEIDFSSILIRNKVTKVDPYPSVPFGPQDLKISSWVHERLLFRDLSFGPLQFDLEWSYLTLVLQSYFLRLVFVENKRGEKVHTKVLSARFRAAVSPFRKVGNRSGL